MTYRWVGERVAKGGGEFLKGYLLDFEVVIQEEDKMGSNALEK